MYRHHILLWSHTNILVGAIGRNMKQAHFHDRNLQFHLGLTLPLWGRICKWYTNELKVFSLWELINQGAPLLHIYIFSQVKSGFSSHKLQCFSRPITLNKCTIIQFWTSHMYICPLHFLKSASSQGLLQRVRERARGEDREETGEVIERGRREKQTEGKIEGVIKKKCAAGRKLHRWDICRSGRLSR